MASVSQKVGFTNITISYSSPGVKGRKVFGEMLPWGVTWRAGANAATKITFSTNVKIGDKDVRAGTYSIFVTPMESGDWTVHLNSKGNQVYAYMNEDRKIDEKALAADDAVMVKVAPKTVSKAERLHYMISAGDNKTATINMHWDTYKISFDVDTQPGKILKGLEEALN